MIAGELMQKRWIVHDRTADNLIDQLLVSRGVEDKDAYLNPDYRKLYDPFLLKGMKELVDRLTQAFDAKEKIAIFGDYDHDGTPAAALLHDGITACGGLVSSVYIPTREEGYGLSTAVIELFAKEGIQLLVTVDCGITNKPEIDYAKGLGLEVIVIDHHIVQSDKFPDAAIVVNPKQDGDTYPFKELCGCGLAFKAIQALGQQTNKISADKLKWYLDLVAISTVCDMVPLEDENRILVHYGMLVLAKTKRLGLQQLMKVAAIDTANITTYTIGFGFGPRLNAPGRLERASIAYELLVTKDASVAETLARRLEQLNKRRQDELEVMLKQAQEVVDKEKLNERKVIMVSGNGWSDGLVGLVAGRLMEKYHRPSFVLSAREDGLAKGSARSIEGFHLVDALNECQQYLTKYGGHAKAAGLTMAQEQLELVYDKLIEIAEQKLSDSDLQPRVIIDGILRPDEVTLATAAELAKLEPHGFGNPKPIVMLEACQVLDVKTIGTLGKHLKMSVQLSNDTVVDVVAFGLAQREGECNSGQLLDMVGFLEINEWRDRKTLQLKAVDWRPHRPVTIQED